LVFLEKGFCKIPDTPKTPLVGVGVFIFNEDGDFLLGKRIGDVGHGHGEYSINEELCYDIGNNQAAFEWIEKYAENFRNLWACRVMCSRHEQLNCRIYDVVKFNWGRKDSTGSTEDKDAIRACCDILVKLRNKL